MFVLEICFSDTAKVVQRAGPRKGEQGPGHFKGQ